MEPSSLTSLSVAILSALFFYFGAKAFYSQWWKPKTLEKKLRQQGIRGNPYRIHYGDMKEEIQALKDAWSRPMELNHKIVPRVVPFIHRMSKKYGKLCLHWAGTTPRVVVWDPDMAREVCLNKTGDMRIPPFNPQVLILANGLSSLDGHVWAKRRRVITPAFHLEKLKGMVPAFTSSCVRLIKKWEELAGAAAEGSYELDVWPEFQNLTADVISQTAFGSSLEEGERIFQLQREQTELVTEALRMPYIPGFRFIPTAKNKRRVAIDKQIKSMLRAIIDNKLKLMETKGYENTDLLGLLLQFASDEKNELTIENVIEECKLFYFAGHETTSTLLTWTMILLSMHPIWQQRARDEVLGICGKNKPDIESINQLKTVSMILNEVLRLYPSAFLMLRETCRETILGELTIPSGVSLMIPTILLHHDPECWGEDADEFKPERFSEGISKATLIGGQSAYFPFGWGPKMCVGQNFAMIEAKMALAMILQHFSFELSPSYTHAPYTVLLLQPQHGAHLILRRLRN